MWSAMPVPPSLDQGRFVLEGVGYCSLSGKHRFALGAEFVGTLDVVSQEDFVHRSAL
jgi:hypothetical protein